MSQNMFQETTQAPSFQLSVAPHRRVAARFVGNVRRRLQQAFAERATIKQTDIARELGVHRSVITRQIRGYQDMTLGRVAELSWALGFEPVFDMIPVTAPGNNKPELPTFFNTNTGTTGAVKRVEEKPLVEMATS
jgi:hypothetical protein